MTPKEKAKEIVSIMDFSNYDVARLCASFCVDEIIKALDKIEGQHPTIYKEEDFMHEVKREINKL